MLELLLFYIREVICLMHFGCDECGEINSSDEKKCVSCGFVFKGVIEKIGGDK